MIRDLETTTVSVHDSRVDLSKEGEVVYRDRRCFGDPSKGYNATMKRKVRGKALNIRDKLRNQRIARKRASMESPYAVIKRIFKSAHIMVTTIKRVSVTMIFTAFSYNLLQLNTVKKKARLAEAI